MNFTLHTIVNPVIIIGSRVEREKMNNYFLISEFAKLRDININSLRYYEKLGLLKPAYVEERTGYRYYSAEQVSVLNKILLCINLGIPLKEMVQYIDEEGNLQSQKLLERGRSVAMERLEQMQNNLNFIEASLKSIEGNKEYVDRKGVYSRILNERKIIVTDFYEGSLEPKKMIVEVSKIYKIAQEKEMFPALPAGQIVEIGEDGRMKLCFFLELMNPKDGHPRIRTLPAGEYSCLQVTLEPTTDFQQIIKEHWGEAGDKTIVVDNVALEKYSFKTRPMEFQKIECS